METEVERDHRQWQEAAASRLAPTEQTPPVEPEEPAIPFPEWLSVLAVLMGPFLAIFVLFILLGGDPKDPFPGAPVVEPTTVPVTTPAPASSPAPVTPTTSIEVVQPPTEVVEGPPVEVPPAPPEGAPPAPETSAPHTAAPAPPHGG